MATASSQDTPRAGRGGGRGRRGGRWGNRQSKADTGAEETCLLAFGSLVNALDSRVNGASFCAPYQASLAVPGIAEYMLWSIRIHKHVAEFSGLEH